MATRLPGEQLNIRELRQDPSDAQTGQPWVLHIPSGTPMGLLLSLTQGIDTYFWSYYTTESTIIRIQAH